jgi:succinate dehydrogenase / fumarate reductase cytochrome b subunit
MGPRISRLHALLGAVPLTGFLVFHTVETRTLVRGPRAFEATWSGTSGAVAVVLEALLVVLPLVLHAALGVRQALRRIPEERCAAYGGRGFAWLQRATGVIALAFVLVHVSQTWLPTLRGATAVDVHEGLRSTLGAPVYLAAYAVGITALCYHVAQGLAAAAVTLRIVDSEAGARAARLVGMSIAVFVWAVSLNSISHFAVGQSFF